MSGLAHLTDRHAVLKAIKEFDSLGRKRFLEKYGFGEARAYFLLYARKQYDSKAIVGASIGHQYGEPFGPGDFAGGYKTVVPRLAALGFHVVATKIDDTVAAIAEELTGTYEEGLGRQVTINVYERSAEARVDCLAIHGTACGICGFSAREAFGEAFTGMIHVHHLNPISKQRAKAKVDPKTNDLLPVCPNCHAAIHFGGVTGARRRCARSSAVSGTRHDPHLPLDRLRGALIGLAVGDAVGTAVEFRAPGTFEPVTDMTGGGSFDLEPGQFTDDTAMALCLAESLHDAQRLRRPRPDGALRPLDARWAL